MQKLRRARRPWGSLSREARGQGVSRQRIWQKMQRQEGRCVLCGDSAEVNDVNNHVYSYCGAHRQYRKAALARYRMRDNKTV